MTELEDRVLVEQRSNEARYLLENPMFIEAFQAIERKYHTLWAQTRSNETEERERIWHCLNALQCVKDELHQHIETGNLQAHHLAQEERKRQYGDLDGSPDLFPGIV